MPDDQAGLSGNGANSDTSGNTLCLNADPASDAYRHVENILGAGAVEAPSDFAGASPRPHLVQLPGDGVVGPHFGLLAIEPDDVNLDRRTLAQGGDRSRTEIKLAPAKGGPHEAFKARQGDTFVYAWRFRIAPTMRFAPSFTHLHQVKAHGGAYAEPPLITFTALADGRLEVRHVGDRQTSSGAYTVLDATPLARLLGQWIDAREEIVFSNSAGRYHLALHDGQGKLLLEIDRAGLAMWRSGADHMRPKWGIYRKHAPALNQHSVDMLELANVAITRGNAPTSRCDR